MNGTQSQSSQATASFNIKKIALITTCLVLSCWCLLWAWASLTTIKVEKNIIQWEQNKAPFSAEQSITFELRLKRSLSLNPLSANTHLLLARLYEQQAINQLDSTQIQNINNAEKHYLLALKKQPTWDYAWAKLAHFYSNFYQNLEITHKNIEQKLLGAITQTIFTGPYEKKCQLVIIPLLFKHWDLVTNISHNKNQAKRVLVHATKNYNQQVALKASVKYNKVHILKPLLKNKSYIKKLESYQKKQEEHNTNTLKNSDR